MKILVLSNEVWNDKINGNNVTSNWFEGLDAEFANIYASPGEPYNKCCNKYFQITDAMMAKSIISGKKAGKRIVIRNTDENATSDNSSSAEEEPKKLYNFLKSISGSFLRFVRELIWLWGRYNKDEMKSFIDGFQPDIIFTERMASVKMLRLEKIVSELTSTPIVAFTGDDEYTLRQINFSPFFWINRFMVRRRLRQMVKKYKIYYTLSQEQLDDYKKRFGCNMKILQKCGSFEDVYKEREIHKPIKLIYAGKFYMNRWKVLGEIASTLKNINKDGVKAILEIYTGDKPTRNQKKLLDDKINSFIMGRVSQERLKDVYKNSDIALHVEARTKRYALATRLSFSTKIIDCIFSGCAVLAYCRDDQSGWLHLKREDAALCVSNHNELGKTMKQICDTPELIKKYAKMAYDCGKKCHERESIQKMLLNDFGNVIKNSNLQFLN